MVECADRDRGKGPGAEQPARRHLGIAAPIAVAPPRDRGVHAFAWTVAHRVPERAHPHQRQTPEPATPQGVARAVAIRLDDGVAQSSRKSGG